MPPQSDAEVLQQAVANGGVVTLDLNRVYTLQVSDQITFPNNLTLHMNGATIYQPGIVDGGANRNAGLGALVIPANAHDIAIDGGMFLGSHTDVLWTNDLCFGALLQGDNHSNISFTNVIFRNLCGFPIAGYATTSSNIVVSYCTFDNLGNGMNIDNPNYESHHNTYTHCEGEESSGTNTCIHDSTYTDVFNAVSLGGDVGSLAGHTGCVVERLTVNGLLPRFSGDTPIAIVAADGLKDAVFRDCNIHLNRVGFGVSAQVSDGYPSTTDGVTFERITVDGAIQAFYLPNMGSRLTNVVVDSCVATNSGAFGLNNSNPNTTFTNNDFRATGTIKDVLLMAGSAGCVFVEPPNAGFNQYNSIEDDR